jgi:hypothetical protein
MERNQPCSEAIGAYQKALGMDKALAVAYLDLGMVYQHIGKKQEAIGTWETATTHVQGRAATKWVHLMLALLYATEEQWASAKRHAEKARDLGFTGVAAELLADIQRHADRKSSSGGQEPSAKRNEELFDAVRAGDTQRVRKLLAKGAEVNAIIKGKGTALHWAALTGRSDVVELLIRSGANLNANDDKYGATPLHLAAYKGNKGAVQTLLNAGADPYAKDKDGDTPLDNALAGGHRDVADLIKTFARR